MMAAYSVGSMISGVKIVSLNQSGKKRNTFLYRSMKRFITITLKHDIFIFSCEPEKKGDYYHRIIIRVDQMSEENDLTGPNHNYRCYIN